MAKRGKLIIVRGLPYSGKTSWTREQCGKNTHCIRVSWTDILHSMSEKEYTLVITHCALFAAACLAKEALSKGMTVYLDEENLFAPGFSIFCRDAEQVGARIEFHLVKCSPEKAKQNCLERGGSSAVLEKIDLLATEYAELLELKR